MSDSSDSETSVVEAVHRSKRSEGTRVLHRQPSNFGVVSHEVVAGHVLSADGSKEPTVMEVAEVMEQRKERDRGKSKYDEDVLRAVREDFSDGAPGGHDIADFRNQFSRPPSEMLARASTHLRLVANKQEEVVGGARTDEDPEQAAYDLGVLVRNSIGQLALTREAVIAAYGAAPEDVLVTEMIKMVEEQDVWDRAMRPNGTRVEDGVLCVSDYVPDFGTPSSKPYINETLHPYSPDVPFTLPCCRGDACIKSRSNIPGMPQFARPEPPVPYRAWIPPDVHRDWREHGIEPEDDWTCFFCHVREVARAVVVFERKGVTPPPLNRHEVVVDPTGITGFPEQMLYDQGRNAVHNGVYGNFPQEAMLQYAPRRSARRRGARDGPKGKGNAAGYLLVVPDFRFTSAENDTA